MRRVMSTGMIAAFCGLAAGCASTPDVGVTYYLPQSTGVLVVTRALRCDIENNLIIVSSVTPRVEQSANTQDPWTIRLANLDSALANTEAKFQFYPDGRLRGFNTSSTGQGGEVLKGAIGLAASVLSLGGVVPFDSGETDTLENRLCNYINRGVKDKNGIADRSQTLVLTFGGMLSIKKEAEEGSVRLAPTPETAVALAQIKKILRTDLFGSAMAVMKLEKAADGALEEAAARCAPEASKVPVTCRKSRPDDVLIKLRWPRAAGITVTLGGTGEGSGFREILESRVLLSQHGAPYFVPVPKAALFGKQTFSLALSEAGTITEIGYGKETGAAQVLGVGQAVVDQFTPSTAAEKAAATKAEADLIAQQQRLARCQVDPAGCQ